LVVLGVNTADDREIAADLLAKKGVTFRNALDPSTDALKALRAYETLGMTAVPMSYLIDREGKVVAAWYGYEKGKVDRLLNDPDLRKRLLSEPSR